MSKHVIKHMYGNGIQAFKSSGSWGGGGLSKMLAICNKVPPPPPIRAWVNEVVIITQRTSKFYK